MVQFKHTNNIFKQTGSTIKSRQYINWINVHNNNLWYKRVNSDFIHEWYVV